MNTALIYIGLLVFLKFSNCSDDKPGKLPSDDDDDTEDLEALEIGLGEFKKQMGQIMADDEIYRKRRHTGRRKHMLARRRRANSEEAKSPEAPSPPIPLKKSKSDTSDMDTPEKPEPDVVFPPPYMVSESITGTPANSPEGALGAVGGSHMFSTPKPITQRRHATDTKVTPQLVRQRGFHDYETERSSGVHTQQVRRREFKYDDESDVSEEASVSFKQRFFDKFFEDEERKENDSFQDADDEDQSIEDDMKKLAEALSEKAKIIEGAGAGESKEEKLDKCAGLFDEEMERRQDEEEEDDDYEEDEEDRGGEE